jgi:uncharacterized phosphosugar-binding protein
METARAYLVEVARRLADPALAATLEPAVEAVLASVRAGGLTYVFGTGHSHLLALELHYRAGGPAFVVPVLDESLMLHEGALASTAREREAGVAGQVLGRYPISSRDVLVVISNSGVNAVPVEAAQAGKAAGARVVALTSLGYSAAAAKGRVRLADLADVVIDNGLPPGDAMAALPGTPLRAGPGSTAIGAAMLQALFAEVAARLAAEGPPPIYLSANMPGAEDHNRDLIERYRPLNPHL